MAPHSTSPELDAVEAYARDVLAGRIVTGNPVRLACERHLRDLQQQEGRGLVWRRDMAERAISFFPEMLVLEDGRPFVLEPWQAFIVGSLFGWYRADGYRRFRTAYIEIGKGNGKTPLAAGIGLYGLVADGEPAPEVYAAATMREQAKIAFKDAVRMVEASTELSALISVQVLSLTIPHESAVFRPVSSEHKGLDGLRVHVGIVDELHEHPSAIVVDKIRAGTKGRQNALIVEITNSGHDRTSVCWHHHELSLKVLAGAFENDGWFAYVCALDEGDDFLEDPSTWIKANPNLGVSIQRRYLQELVEDARGMPSKANIVLRLNGCVWTEQADRWITVETWDNSAGELPARLTGQCHGGLVLSNRDLSALVLAFRNGQAGYDLLCRFWMPAQAKQEGRSEEDQQRLASWARSGFLTLTPGNVTDYEAIGEQLLEVVGSLELLELAYDKRHSSQLVAHLQEELGDEVLVGVSLGMQSMAGPVKEIERLLGAQTLRHGGHPVLRWMAMNAAVREDGAGDRRFDVSTSGDNIGGMLALALAVRQASVGEAPPRSSYRNRTPMTTAEAELFISARACALELGEPVPLTFEAAKAFLAAQAARQEGKA